MIDPRTAAILMLIGGIECSLLFFAAGAMRRKTAAWINPPSLFWGIGTSIHVLGVLALLSQGRSSPWIGIIFANSAILLGQLFILAGLRRLVGASCAFRRYAASLLAYTLLAVLLTFRFPSASLRVLMFSLAVGAFYLEGAILCHRARSSVTGPITALMSIVFVLLCLFFLARAAFTVLEPQASIFSRNPFNAATFAVSNFGLIAWCLGLILMQNKRTERELERAIDEKAVLLRELQHRVKNSISVIAGLVSLESSRLEDPRAAPVLEALQGRITAIAELYDRLFRSGETELVELDAYLGAVAEGLFAGQAAVERGIALALALEALRIEAKRAVPLGLIANELLTDSLKYAFPAGRRGSVRLGLRREGGELLLEVADDGVGLPPGFAVGSGSGLGLVLAEMLAKQVGGSLAAGPSPEGGARFSVSFPEAEPA
ncbi:MAG TPA: sensor histidine kinase [Spirochaetia bacterium]|nr:sensor histidine kinase [Spirochaetia bacterium]